MILVFRPILSFFSTIIIYLFHPSFYLSLFIGFSHFFQSLLFIRFPLLFNYYHLSVFPFILTIIIYPFLFVYVFPFILTNIINPFLFYSKNLRICYILYYRLWKHPVKLFTRLKHCIVYLGFYKLFRHSKRKRVLRSKKSRNKV